MNSEMPSSIRQFLVFIFPIDWSLFQFDAIFWFEPHSCRERKFPSSETAPALCKSSLSPVTARLLEHGGSKDGCAGAHQPALISRFNLFLPE